jgi:hypothetical protein
MGISAGPRCADRAGHGKGGNGQVTTPKHNALNLNDLPER